MSQVFTLTGDFTQLLANPYCIGITIPTEPAARKNDPFWQEIIKYSPYMDRALKRVDPVSSGQNTSYLLHRSSFPRKGRFESVLCVGDDGMMPVSDLVFALFKAAHGNNIESLAVPVFGRSHPHSLGFTDIEAFLWGLELAHLSNMIPERTYVVVPPVCQIYLPLLSNRVHVVLGL